MKILVIINEYPPYAGCGYPLLCEEAVNEFKKRGHSVHVLTGKSGCNGQDTVTQDISRILEFCPHNRLNEPESYSLFSMLKWYYREWQEQRKLKHFIHELKPDIIFMWATKGFSYSVASFFLNKGIPLSGYVCGFWLKDHNISAPFRRQYQFWEWGNSAFKRKLKTALEFILPIDHQPLSFNSLAYNTKTTALAHTELSVSETSPRLICDSIPVHQFMSLPRPNLDKPRKLLFFGRIVRNKDPLTLINACIQIQKQEQYADIELNLVGWQTEPDYIAELHTAIASSPNPAAFNFIDPIDYEEIPQLLAKHHAIIVPSLVDALPRTAAEALAAGLVLFVSNKAGITEYLTHKSDAMIFPAEDTDTLTQQLIEVLSNPSLAATLQANGQTLAKNFFSTARMVDEMETMLNETINSYEK